MAKILQNAAQHIPTGTIIISRHRHDFAAFLDDDGEIVFAVDGGNDYFRRVGSEKDFRDLSFTNETPITEKALYCLWGVWNEKKKKHEYKFLRSLSSEHLKNIIRTQQIDAWLRDIILYILSIQGYNVDGL